MAANAPPRVCALCGRQESEDSANVLGEMLGPFYEDGGSAAAAAQLQAEGVTPPFNACPPCPPPRGGDGADNMGDAPGSSGVLFVHRLCALWSPEVYVSNETGKLRNVLAAVRRGRALRCHCCKEFGATLGCIVESCPRSYHVPCAQQDGCCFRVQQFIMACPLHKKRLPHTLSTTNVQFRNGGAAGGGESRRVSRLVTGRNLKRRREPKDRREDTNDARAKRAHGGAQLLRPVGWDDDDEFQAKCQRSLAKDAARVLPVFIGGPTPSSDASRKGQKDDKKAGPSNLPSRDHRADAAEILIRADSGLESVVGQGPAVRALREAVLLPLLYPDVLKSMGITAPRGVLLYGAPGTGKTLSVRALVTAAARMCTKLSDAEGRPRRIAFYHRTAADCLGKFHGQAERTLRMMFASARENAPSIIFIDEIDGLLPARGGRGCAQDHLHTSVVTTMLALMDDMTDRGNVIVIGATNRPESIDPALRRPGRFDREVHCPLPSRDEREKIISMYTREWLPRPCASTIGAVAMATRGYAGADIKALCSSVMMTALARKKSNLLRVLMQEDTLQCMLADSHRMARTDGPVAKAEDGAPADAANNCTLKETGLSLVEAAPRVSGCATAANEAGLGLGGDVEANGAVGADGNANGESKDECLEKWKRADDGIESSLDSDAADEVEARDKQGDDEVKADGGCAGEEREQDQGKATHIGDFLSELTLKIDVTAADWRQGMKQMPPPCSKRSSSAGSLTDSVGPIPYELSHVLIPSLRELVSQVADCDAMRSGCSPSHVKMKEIVGAFNEIDSDVAAEARLRSLGVVGIAPSFPGDTSSGGLDGTHCDAPTRVGVDVPAAGSDGSSASGMRFLVGGGDGGDGQKQLAGCLLHIFNNERIVTVSLPLLLAEGAGNTFDGMVMVMESTLAFSTSSVVLYLPRIDTWVDERDEGNDGQHPRSSKAWEVFEQHIGSLSRHKTVHLIATTGTLLHNLNDGVQRFFCGVALAADVSVGATGVVQGPANGRQRADTAYVHVPVSIGAVAAHEMFRRKAAQIVSSLLLDWLDRNKQPPATGPETPDREAEAVEKETAGLEMGRARIGGDGPCAGDNLGSDSPSKRTRPSMDHPGTPLGTKVPVAKAAPQTPARLRHVSLSLRTIGHRLLRDHRVTSLDEHLMTTEMDSSKTLRAVAQRAAGGDYGTDVSSMTSAMHAAAAAHHSVALRWMRKHKSDGDGEDIEALMAADGAKAAADDHSRRLFDLEKIIFEYRKEESAAANRMRDQLSKDKASSSSAAATAVCEGDIASKVDELRNADAADRETCEAVARRTASIVRELTVMDAELRQTSICWAKERVVGAIRDRCGLPPNVDDGAPAVPPPTSRFAVHALLPNFMAVEKKLQNAVRGTHVLSFSDIFRDA